MTEGPRVQDARARLLPGDITLRRTRGYQWLRRASLLVSLLVVFGTPLWHLRALEAESAGLARGGPWALLGEQLGLPVGAPPVVGAPWTVRLFGLEVMDPLAGLSVMVARGPRTALLLGLLPALLLCILLGRFFCGWVCPYVPLLSASNALRWLLGRLGMKLPDLRVPRQLALGVLVLVLGVGAVGGTQLAPLLYPPALVGREAFRLIFFGGFGVGTLVLGAAFAFDTFVSRAGFCRSLCPGGALFSLLASRSPLRVERTASACTDCTVCDVVCNLGQRPMTDQLDAGCERCGRCVSACPTGALRLTLGSRVPPGGREGEGTR